MMKRRHIWKVILGFSIVFIITQMYVWLGVINRDMISPEKKLFQRFLDLSEKLDLSVFLIDTLILEHLLSARGGSDVTCYILCKKSHNSIIFGLEGEALKQESQKFNITASYFSECVYSTLPSNEQREARVPVHCWWRSQDLSIHVVLFYNIHENMYWHGSMPGSTLMYGSAQGIFNRIYTKLVTVDGFDIRIPQYPHAFLAEQRHSKFIPCNQTRAEHFFGHFGKDSTEQAESFHSKAVAVLKQAKSILDDLKVPFWLSSGTCLGWFRQCDIIPYSKDVDIGIFIKDYVVSLVPSMEDAGLQLKHKFGKIKDSFELSFQAEDLKLDIFFFYEDKTSIWNGGTQTSTGYKYKYIFPKFTLCWTLFFSLLVRVPCETESYVQANYGLNWFVPVKDWDWKDSPSNVQPNGVWPLEEREEVINVYI